MKSDKRFVCDHSGCGRSFSRLDHLSRHQLNHDPSNILHCDRCPRSFVRADLLERHLRRHEQREELGDAPGPLTPAVREVVAGPSVSRGSSGSNAGAGSGSVVPTLPPAIVEPSPKRRRVVKPRQPSPEPELEFEMPAGALESSEDEEEDDDDADWDALAAPAPAPAPRRPQPALVAAVAAAVVNSAQTSTVSGCASATSTPPSTNGGGPLSPKVGAGQPVTTAPPTTTVTPQSQSHPQSQSQPASVVQTESWRVSPSDALSSYLPAPTLAIDWLAHNDAVRGIVPASPALRFSPSSIGVTPFPPVSYERTSALKDASVSVTFAKVRMLQAMVAPLVSHPSQLGLLNPDSVEAAIGAYWASPHTVAPILHRPTLIAEKTEPVLLIAMIVIGMAGPMDEWTRQLHQALAATAAKNLLEGPPLRWSMSDLARCQAMVTLLVYHMRLVETCDFDLVRSLVSALCTSCDRANLSATMPGDDTARSVEERWRIAIAADLLRRLVVYTVWVDACHSLYFEQMPCIEPLGLDILMPMSAAAFEAVNAATWHAAYTADLSHQISWAHAVRTALAPHEPQPQLSANGCVSIIGGLLAVVADMKWRGRNSSSSVVAAADWNERWRAKLTAALSAWKSRLDVVAARAPWLQVAVLSGYAMGQTLLAIDTQDLQAFVGHDALRYVSRAHANQPLPDRREVYDRLTKWAQSSDGREAAWHCAWFVRTALGLDEAGGEFGTHLLKGHYELWSVYIAVLCLHAYGTLSGRPDQPGSPIIDAKTYLDAMAKPTAEQTGEVAIKGSTTGVLLALRSALEASDWSLTHLAARILSDGPLRGY